jgi:outer membrane protein OmpA-like peptidoglycan-associated protein
MIGRLWALLMLLQITALPAQPPAAVSNAIVPRTFTQVYSGKISRAASVDELSSVLKEAFRSLYAVNDDAVPDLYGKANGYLTTLKAGPAGRKNDPRARAAFSACSLATLTAVLQMVQARCDRDIRRLQEQRSDIREKIRTARQRICELEKSGGSAGTTEADPKFIEMQSPQIQVAGDSRGTIISVSDILFKTDSASLTPDLITSLTRLAEILLASTNYRVVIEGHTDNRGPESYNQTLSEQRAANVRQFLAIRGVAADRLSAVGYGMSRPAGDNETVDGRKKNRRVDIVVQNTQNSADSTAPRPDSLPGR